MKSKRGWVATNRLKTRELFGSLFPRDEKMIDAIAEHMAVNGYDEAQSIIVWDRTKEEGKNALYVVDGHTRKCAAAKAGLSPVYVARVKFTGEQEALEYAIHNQRDRRNITDADLIRCIRAVDSRKTRGGDRKSEAAKSKGPSGPIETKSSAQQTADIVGTSQNKVKKARTVIDHADKQTKQEVESGKKSINKAYQETQETRKEQAPMHLPCNDCRREPRKIDRKTGQPFKHGLCNKCRKEKIEGDKLWKAKGEKRRRDFEATSIDAQAEKEWLYLVAYLRDNSKHYNRSIGKISQEAFDKIMAVRWWLDETIDALALENWPYPRDINFELVSNFDNNID